MISIITAIHNQLAMNRLYYDSLLKYTYHPFELIIIDNCSTDGSAEFFEGKEHVKVIRNKQNYTYPYCQNQGISVAKYEYMAFLNNDIMLAPQWDKKMIEGMEKLGLEVASPGGIERAEDAKTTLALRRRWKMIKNISIQFGASYFMLKLMIRIMYGNWEKYCAQRYARFGINTTVEGIVGSSVIIKHSAFDKIGLWDERIQSADFDIFLRTKKRNLEKGDIKPVQVFPGVFNHHYTRLTVKARKKTPFADAANIIAINDKWTKKERDLLMKDSDHF